MKGFFLERLRVENVSQETKKQLQDSAKKLYGKANASLLVRELISKHLRNENNCNLNLESQDFEDINRIELRLPEKALIEFEKIAESHLSTKHHYMSSILLAHLGNPQLQIDEIEVLRRSNYEIAKIGTNLNQIAKAFNTLVIMGGDEKLPELGKKLAALNKEIKAHTKLVLNVLNNGTRMLDIDKRKYRKLRRK